MEEIICLSVDHGRTAQNMKFFFRLIYSTIVSVTAIFSFAAACSAAEPVIPSQTVQERLRYRIETEYSEDVALCHGEVLCGLPMIPIFYHQRNYHLAWSDYDGPSGYINTFMKFVERAEDHGLRPSDYHLYSINILLQKMKEQKRKGLPLNLDELIDLDLLLTDGFLLYCSHLSDGRVNAETLHSEWIPYNHLTDYAAILSYALRDGTILKTLTGLAPPHKGYKRMRKALQRMRMIVRNGGWPSIDTNVVLKKGDENRDVWSLRKRLIISGDLPVPFVSGKPLFDDPLEKGVKRFQARHGIKVDGQVGEETLAALNVSATQRQRQIEINMERWRWIPNDLGRRHLLINIADYKMQMIEDLQNVMEMRVVVGKRQRKTPVFSDRMEYLVLNPYWYLPPTIVLEDLLPKIKKNPEHLEKNNIKIFKAGTDYQKELDPHAIDWENVSENRLPYVFRQGPGPYNALGRIKFMFPNQFFIYLHDTPRRESFSETSRDFSSGCIRVEKPVELAAYLLRDDRYWTREKLEQALENGERRVIRITDKVLVHILYWTAWVDDQDMLHFRKDVYERDDLLDKALRERPPSP